MSRRTPGRAIRFRPPRLEVPPEVRWMLLRAFGPPGAPFAEAFDSRDALVAARRFEVSSRIVSRQGRERLAGELEPAAAAGFQRDHAAAAAVGLRFLALAAEVAETAAALGLPLVLLKFAALEKAGFAALGARSACDLDILAPEERAAELQHALLALGWRLSGMPAMEHQLAPVEHPNGGVVEVHRVILGVRLDGGVSATVEALQRNGLLRPFPDLPGRCAAPAVEVLAAHALVHGLGQHGWWPASYSLLKTMADLIDLGFHTAGSPLAARAAELVERDVTAAEAAAARDLCAALAAGIDGVGLLAAESGAAVLLRHILAGRLDAEYEASLRLGFFRPQPSDRLPVVRFARSVLGAVFLTRGQIDAIYGPPRHPLGYLGRRLARPFDLLRRLGRYSARTVRLRLDRP
ncbi:MAG TPA: nucleotidyltransferase family protein [Thermoanaerobaculia bacterium]|jgi:hypothetical protein|nr:nucleotidyltransferase family protein [Thermoanaerobaculia bacterium]